ncbi:MULTISPECIES: amino acid ABC transporter ATP-binding protein [Erwiniaceae]|uniref:Amino acid ABC transporter ATP-binding protein n=1 Tax=Pantoea coffeiphila TaxID=1465635 RepID=A0A2S9IDA6_9GAMM|nr:MULTISPECIES: amino acid ABC transporter ATP-binding protein [Erwiniaceae]MBK0002482.1 amino acid ABC transporter ATP-binding protein [Erwinia sp. S38]PRD15714.1 amino acid ABC transporter ATP-binding protein [Pantoea coffeiphila]
MLTISKLNKFYDKTHVLKDVDLSVAQGEVVAIIGPSGSGKSTLLRCINLLEKPESGTLTIDDLTVDVAKISTKQENALRQQTGMVFQHYNLFKNKTALQNITEGLIIGKKMPKAEADAIGLNLLEKVGLREKADSYPAMLSGGQQQRVAIARSLAVKPKVILLDEPTSALDPELVQEVLQVIRSIIDHQTTILLVTHEMSFARDIADRIIFMADGAIVEDGEPEQIFTRPQHQRTQRFLLSYQNDVSGHRP